MLDENKYIPLSEMPHYAKKKPSVFQNPFNKANLEATKQRGVEALHAAKVVGKGAVHGIQAAHAVALDLKKSETAKHLRKVGYGQEHQFGISYFNQPSKKQGLTKGTGKKTALTSNPLGGGGGYGSTTINVNYQTPQSQPIKNVLHAKKAIFHQQQDNKFLSIDALGGINTNNPNKKKKFNRGVPDFGFGFV